jgi:hypothetical protein
MRTYRSPDYYGAERGLRVRVEKFSGRLPENAGARLLYRHLACETASHKEVIPNPKCNSPRSLFVALAFVLGLLFLRHRLTVQT